MGSRCLCRSYAALLFVEASSTPTAITEFHDISFAQRTDDSRGVREIISDTKGAALERSAVAVTNQATSKDAGTRPRR